MIGAGEINTMSEDNERLIKEHREKDPTEITSKWREKLLVVTLLTCQFIALCTDTFLFPFFPQVAKSKGLTDTQIGIVFATIEFSRFVTSLLVGYIIGKVDSRTLCILGSSLATVTCFLFGLITYAPDNIFFPLCIIVRFLAGAGAATLSVSLMTVLMKVTSYQPGTIVGLSETFQAAGYAGGPAVGAGLQELGGYTCMFWTLGAVLTLTCVVQPFIIPSVRCAIVTIASIPSALSSVLIQLTKVQGVKNLVSAMFYLVHQSDTTPKTSAANMWKIPGVILLALHLFIYRVISSSRQTGMSSYLYTTFETKSSTAGLFFGLWSAIYLLCCPLMTRLVNKGFIYTPIVIAWCISILVNVFAGPSPILDFIFHGHTYLTLTVVLLCVSNIIQPAIYIPPFQAGINLAIVNGYEKDGIQTYGMVTGLLNSGLGLGSMVGPILSGIMTEYTTYTWNLTLLSGLGVVMLTLMSSYLVFMKLRNIPLKAEDEMMKLLCKEESQVDDEVIDADGETFTQSENEVKGNTTSFFEYAAITTE